MQKIVVSTYQKMNKKYLAFCTAVMAVILAVLPMAALATETETEKGVKEITTSVSSEGVAIILAVLTGLVALIVAVIVIPKAIGFIRRFV